VDKVWALQSIGWDGGFCIEMLATNPDPLFKHLVRELGVEEFSKLCWHVQPGNTEIFEAEQEFEKGKTRMRITHELVQN